jgi:hypothetical protein
MTQTLMGFARPAWRRPPPGARGGQNGLSKGDLAPGGPPPPRGGGGGPPRGGGGGGGGGPPRRRRAHGQVKTYKAKVISHMAFSCPPSTIRLNRQNRGMLCWTRQRRCSRWRSGTGA